MSDPVKRNPPPQGEADRLHAQLKKIQEPKGYYFNKDDSYTRPLLEQLLALKERYGYMACPCRFANGSYELDKDIICPCVYRADDVQEYGACFCALYVSREWNEGGKPHEYVPDRRPPDKIKF